jgi:hypothetical protein
MQKLVKYKSLEFLPHLVDLKDVLWQDLYIVEVFQEERVKIEKLPLEHVILNPFQIPHPLLMFLNVRPPVFCTKKSIKKLKGKKWLDRLQLFCC